ncbi:family 20 glycosylhydrolase [Bacteroides helcogenes]|uniref:Glycoside hydrolase, family 20, catalytic core n=1 Tax=Bacteroides helcogenes (strain ATCC 35417 / DSM 20613 / JCM 6297 / CCUG 15421 / P 36-108) TaxID=693979 RepID=E6SS94_BACT6|nr:family 20 glycosylhydrolase [Bacteroides helcogenes]ADV44162.1 Glycoside hydrolase, family 20, catalytic core [Bacteroides helcogenes P 36-108]MDY5238425.1 family 20 glycosylhydrolase [Bacteroides helcogenes]
MKKIFFTLCVVLCVCEDIFAGKNEKPFVIPELKEWKGAEGFFSVSTESRIVYGSEALLGVAEQFAADYHKMFGVSLNVALGSPRDGDFFLTLGKDKKLGKEGYSIRIGGKVTVSAPEAIGVYWATRTLLQMSEQDASCRLPKGSLRDYPDYAVRGFMMDCGRKFIPMDYLDDLVSVMSYYKMNVLQVHLNDNGFKQFFNNDWNKTYAAFRLECETFPGLTARDGYYTKKEFVNFQKTAAGRFVEIIPEIDAPAHTLAFSHYNPELGSKEYGMDHLDLFNPETYMFMDALFKEYLGGESPVFCGSKVHIGTDEYSNKKQDVVEKFRAFTDRYIRLAESYGKQACVWGALTHARGVTPVKSENVIMSAWYNGYADPKAMVEQGYKLISIPDGLVYIVPAAGYYADYLNTKYLYDNWTPAHVGKVTFDEKDPAILGGMFAVWNDHVGNGISVADIHHRLFPALQTLSAKTWTGKSVSVAYAEFEELRRTMSEAPGVNRLGRVGDRHSLVLEKDEVLPGTKSPYTEIGYDYTVSFDVEAAPEVRNTVLFSSPNATFYLSDPISGKIGFARDGYLNTFNYQFYPSEKANVTIVGDNASTSLIVNGKLIEKLDVEKRYWTPKDTTAYVRTLFFPLQQAGDFKSRISNLKIYNYCR